MKIQCSITTSLLCLLLLSLNSCSSDNDDYSRYENTNPNQVSSNPVNQKSGTQVAPNYYRQGQQQAPQAQYQQPPYQQQQPYQQQYQDYYQQQPQQYQQQGGSRYYSNPYSIPPSSSYQNYDADQYYVPPTNYGTEPHQQSITDKH